MKKYALFTFGVSFMLVLSCSDIQTEDQLQSLPGTYIRYAEHEYGKEFDTLVITSIGSEHNHFKVLRKFQYDRVRDGQALEPEYKQTTTTLVFEIRNQLLQENETGKIYSVDPDKGKLLVGSTEYKKL